jgi:long-chain acyl-CoA synthetase
MKVVDIDNGHILNQGEVGEIAVRGPNVILGFWNRPSETDEVIKEGWFHTGDIGKMDYEGYFYLVDRLRDMINVGGLKVYPAEVEKILAQHQTVAEVSVYGVSDTLMGEQVKASVVQKSGLSVTAEELIAFCLKRIANFKVPSTIEFVDTIPKSPTGKVLRRVLRQDKWQPGAVPASTPDAAKPATSKGQVSTESIQNWITNWMVKQLEIETNAIEPKKVFADYGMNSIMNLKLTQELGKWLGQTLEVVLAWRYPSVDSMARYLANQFDHLASSEQTIERSFMEYVPFVQRQFDYSETQIELWPSVAEFFVYDEFLYNALTHDEQRNHSYKVAINQR